MSVTEALSRLSFQGDAFEPGHVWLAGAGPGSLGCLTLDVIHALGSADAVVYDALVDPRVLQAAPGASLHYVGKRGGRPSVPQGEINRLMVTLAREGKRVLRLKGGDPNVFGRGAEEALELGRAGIPFRFVAGVTAALGALAHAGIPATMRGVNKAIVLATGHGADADDDLDWAALAAAGQPIVIYMGVGNLRRIAGALLRGGLAAETPAALIMSATTPEEKVLVATLDTLADRAETAGFASPSLIVVGGIVAMRETLQGGGGA